MFSTGSSFSYNQSMNINGNPSSSIHQDMINPAPFLELLPPLLDDNDQDFLLNLLLSQQQRQEQQQQQIQCSKSGEIVMDGDDAASNKASATNNVSTRSGKKSSCKRKSGKKDRHSKIYTAQGPRDRRMRLSLPTATKFFDLQDMLGFDKASKTIEWLFSKSKAAIKDLTCVGGGRCVSSSSASEAVSIVKMSSTRDGEMEVGDAESCGNVVCGEEEKKRNKKLVKQGQLLQTKESRDRARARARERTTEKMKIKQDVGSCSSQEMNEAKSDELLGHQMDSVSIMEKLLGTSGQSPSSIFNCSTTYNIGTSRSDWKKSKDIVIPGNWGIYNDSYYSALTNTKPLPGNPDHHHQVQNPSAIFATNPNDQQQRRVSTLQQNPTLISQEQNPNSALYPSFSRQNLAGYYPGFASPEIVLHPDHQFLQQDNHFSENSNFPSEYGCYCLY